MILRRRSVEFPRIYFQYKSYEQIEKILKRSLPAETSIPYMNLLYI